MVANMLLSPENVAAKGLPAISLAGRSFRQGDVVPEPVKTSSNRGPSATIASRAWMGLARLLHSQRPDAHHPCRSAAIISRATLTPSISRAGGLDDCDNRCKTAGPGRPNLLSIDRRDQNRPVNLPRRWPRCDAPPPVWASGAGKTKTGPRCCLRRLHPWHLSVGAQT